MCVCVWVCVYVCEGCTCGIAIVGNQSGGGCDEGGGGERLGVPVGVRGSAAAVRFWGAGGVGHSGASQREKGRVHVCVCVCVHGEGGKLDGACVGM